MPAPLNNANAAKADKDKVAFPKSPIRGTQAERKAWNRAQAKSGQNWNDWGRAALNKAAGIPPP